MRPSLTVPVSAYEPDSLSVFGLEGISGEKTTIYKGETPRPKDQAGQRLAARD